MTMVEAVRRALAEVGEVSNEELAAHIRNAYGVTVRPNFVPVAQAAAKDLDNLAEWRRRTAAASAASLSCDSPTP